MLGSTRAGHTLLPLFNCCLSGHYSFLHLLHTAEHGSLFRNSVPTISIVLIRSTASIIPQNERKRHSHPEQRCRTRLISPTPTLIVEEVVGPEGTLASESQEKKRARNLTEQEKLEVFKYMISRFEDYKTSGKRGPKSGSTREDWWKDIRDYIYRESGKWI